MEALADKFLQTDQIMLSCLLQKAQKSRQHALAAEERLHGLLPLSNEVVVGIQD
jgi:hypothetical protein